jgi:fibronectin-binding autotransporter adhesin
MADRFAVWGQGYGSWGRSNAATAMPPASRTRPAVCWSAPMLRPVRDPAPRRRRRLQPQHVRREQPALLGRERQLPSRPLWRRPMGGAQPADRRELHLARCLDPPHHRLLRPRRHLARRLRCRHGSGFRRTRLPHRARPGFASFEPFAGLAYVNLHSDGFSESGGAAALSARSDDTSLGYSTLGLRAATNLACKAWS